MSDLLQFVSPATEEEQAAVRRQLRNQIAHLEAELASLFCSAYPRKGFDWKVEARRGPRLLSLSELEELRDDLAQRLQHNRRALSERTYVEELGRRRIEEMMLAPEEHKWVRVRNVDIGERGCKQWHVVPRFGPLGMLMNWWRVKISSGCPLAGGAASGRVPDRISRVMGKRSRKRGEVEASPTTRAERDAARARRAAAAQRTNVQGSRRPRAGRTAIEDRPPAPWGNFPLVELVVLLALILIVAGFIVRGQRGGTMIVGGLALGSLAGIELSIREHFGGFRSHTTLLAAVAGFIAGAVAYLITKDRTVTPAVAIFVFMLSFWLLRQVFQRRTGGAAFRR